jgi:Rrp15p
MVSQTSNSRPEKAATSHQKKRKRQSGRQAAIKNKKLLIDDEQLDRFAGSSEEEVDDQDNDEFDDVSDDENEGPYLADNPMQQQEDEMSDDGDKDREREKDRDIENENTEEMSNDISDDEEESASGIQITSGLANAMSRILSSGATAHKASKSTGVSSAVILSKTKTPLQIQAAKEKKMQESLKESRRLNRERKLTALHVPLTVATSMAVSTPSDATGHSSLAAELQAERTHRRVATRGVVALFNAIAQHQAHPDQTATAAAAASDQADRAKKAPTGTTKLTKCGFLDLIKQKAAASSSQAANILSQPEGSSTVVGNKAALNGNNDAATKKWDALKDDYLMGNSKNWDQIDSD